MDIVERLRNLETKLPTTSDNWLEARELQQEAAAEIERLREAMEPFARFFKSGNHDLSVAQDHTIVATFLGADKLPLAELTIADFRRVDAALSGKTEDERG